MFAQDSGLLGYHIKSLGKNSYCVLEMLTPTHSMSFIRVTPPNLYTCMLHCSTHSMSFIRVTPPHLYTCMLHCSVLKSIQNEILK